jgi:hypothetical protein
MGYRYALRLRDGTDAGEAEYGFQPQPGDEIYVDGAKRVRVRAAVPVETVGEFVDGALYGVLEIEPI